MATSVEERMVPSFGVPWPDFNDGLTYTDVVKPTPHAPIAGMTLIEFYSSKHTSSAPLQGWFQRIRNGQITIDGQIVTDPDTILRVGSKLLYHRLPWKEPYAPHLLQVLFEDDDMVAINKPAGLQVLPGGLFQQRTVLTQLHWRTHGPSSLLVLSGMPSDKEMQPVPVHRLGRGTSGILLCAKTKHAKAQLAAYLADGTSVITANRYTDTELGANRRISKIYRALATGIFDSDEIVVKQPIGIMQYPGVSKGLYVALPSGKPAVSKIKVVDRDAQAGRTLVQVEIQSGRPHQIRIHLSFIGHPLLGDPLYDVGGRPKCFESESRDENFAEDGGYQRPTKPVPGDCGYHLHAHRLVLCHPTTKEEMANLAKLDFKALEVNGENYLSWYLDAKIHLQAKKLGDAIKEGNTSSPEVKELALIFLQHHIHENLKIEYLTLEDLLTL